MYTVKNFILLNFLLTSFYVLILYFFNFTVFALLSEI